jgi:hypothetical protein
MLLFPLPPDRSDLDCRVESAQVSTERGSKGHCVVSVYDLVVAMADDMSGRSCRTFFEPLVCDGVPVLQDGKQMHVRFTVTAQGHTTAERSASVGALSGTV